VKFIIWKKALTLVELVISITISTMVMLIVMTFIADSMETVVWSNQKTKIFEDVFIFKDHFWKFSRGWFFDHNLIISNESWTWNDIILLKNIDSSAAIIYWVVDKNTNKLATNSTYKIYEDKVIGYRKLSSAEIVIIEADPDDVYNLTFFRDKLYDGLKIKDFQIDLYNSDTILDVNMAILLHYNNTIDWTLLSKLSRADIIDINLNF
jgi:hypothetical protein